MLPLTCLYFFRYADVLVHRLLAVAIGADASYPDLLNKHKTQVRCSIVIPLYSIIYNYVTYLYSNLCYMIDVDGN